MLKSRFALPLWRPRVKVREYSNPRSAVLREDRRNLDRWMAQSFGETAGEPSVGIVTFLDAEIRCLPLKRRWGVDCWMTRLWHRHLIVRRPIDSGTRHVDSG